MSLIKHRSAFPAVLAFIFCLPFNLFALSKPHTTVELLSEKKAISPGESFDVGLHLKMDPHWHTYWKDPGDSGLATSVDWKLPKGFSADPIRWPKPITINFAGSTIYGYESEVLLLVKIHAPSSGLTIGETTTIQGTVSWLECAEICVPGSQDVEIKLPIASKSVPADATTLALFEKYRGQIPPDDYHPSKEKTGNQSQTDAAKSITSASAPVISSATSNVTFLSAMVAAFIGGLILNLMPCVLPVIAIKILGFVKQSQSDPGEVKRLGNLFTLGVMVSFWIFAAVVVGLRHAGQIVGWGFQFQDVRFVLLMLLVVTLVALNFFGVFEIQLGGRIMNEAGGLASRTGRSGAFFNGILATTLATPCTAPFLAPALGFAFTQPAWAIFGIFTSVGLGLALPYWILSWNPALMKWLPKPGAWMILFKQAMGFPMLATGLWLVWVIGSAYGNDAALVSLAWVLLAAFVIWIACIGEDQSKRRIKLSLALIFILIVGIWKVLPMVSSGRTEKAARSEGLIEWQKFSRKNLDEALKSDHVVFIDFTADWCLTCQVNKRTSIEIPTVAAKFREMKVIPMIADWTKNDPEITEMLRSFGRSGVPVYVFYPKDRARAPIILSEVLTPSQVLDALAEAGK